jgi:hypothetical protein
VALAVDSSILIADRNLARMTMRDFEVGSSAGPG